MKTPAFLLFFACVLLITAEPAGSQIYSASECKKTGDPSIAAKIKSGKIEKLSWMGRWHLGLYICGWSTSFLPPTGTAPKCPDNLEELPDWESIESDYQEKLEKWSCMYSARSAMDSDPRTAWCEGKKDNGIGEILLVKVDTSRHVKIWAGLGASPALHKKNSRPKRVRVYVLQAKKAGKDIGQYATIIRYQDIIVLGSREYILSDINGYQNLPLPKHTRNNSVENSSTHRGEPVKIADTTFVAIEILSVYPGTKYRDTCISEVMN